jgi:hypothetical protein
VTPRNTRRYPSTYAYVMRNVLPRSKYQPKRDEGQPARRKNNSLPWLLGERP